MTTNQFKLCPKFEKTFGILGKKWNGLIIDVLLNEGPQRFKDLALKVEKCSDRVLVERLRELQEDGLVLRQVAADGRPIYRLTAQGEDLRPIMQGIHTWAEKWFSLADCQ
ncbi:MAG: helix-turn-helix transcriptional regulator [Liquorilactobacillus nagelii]|jgi:DNA-binding HxlR family transcriptional regulator|uniref:winged helix-turn-helix transcriptional regulator n=1 Tax=Liquorilactobacillus nagelii TaxID=82688 RepID=UPI00242B66F7|nr:helix-turn-helix domain-containing protein [Liquorilactobacillus nagelii]MCI1634524.1 helix-turn-helix transcriptional regulator [Liquorilactobacillus nagelii]MCI1920439.1 helix-turn-helix transcriptional regulator [Liquorilactobacillus nagelii]MCI1976083.1 helix-turn-helix transcriptional regulator [Liquorilactobacillus nagelii]